MNEDVARRIVDHTPYSSHEDLLLRVNAGIPRTAGHLRLSKLLASCLRIGPLSAATMLRRNTLDDMWTCLSVAGAGRKMSAFVGESSNTSTSQPEESAASS